MTVEPIAAESDAHALSYATPVAAARPLWPAVVMSILSLGLIFLAGCFLIGVGLALEVIGYVSPHPTVWTAGHYAYVAALYICAGVSFISGLIVAVIAVRLARGVG